MTMSIKAHFDGKTIVPDEPVNLPVNQPLRVKVEVTGEQSGTAGDLANSELFGLWKDRTDIGDSVEFARKLRKEAETRRHEIDDPS
jgi:hypothetical protein